ncbi:MAG: hypothetical protein AB1735_06900 [Pseudomonadota bacterium]|jgi:hypothetical protein
MRIVLDTSVLVAAARSRQGAGGEPAEPQVVDTLGGRLHVRWDEGGQARVLGTLMLGLLAGHRRYIGPPMPPPALPATG